MSIDPALTVSCPTCFVGPGQPCRSRHAVTLHQSRRQALADLGKQADRILGAGRRKPRKPASMSPPVPVVADRTGEGNVIPDDEGMGPPWD